MISKIDKAILRLNKNVERHKKHKLIQFENDILKINNCGTEFWGTFFYLIFLIIAPIGILFYEVLFDHDYLKISLLTLSISVLIYYLIKIVIGGTKLEINLKEEYYTIENNHLLFKKIIKLKKINFNEIIKSELSEITIKHKHSTSNWLRLSVNDRNDTKHILTDFANEYPESSIANDVKNLIDATIMKNQI